MLNENKPAASALGLEIFQKSAWLLSQEVSDLLLAFLFTFVALRRLGPENFGLLTLTQAILNLSGLASFNLELALIRMVPEARGLGRWRQARWMIGISELVKGSLALLVAGILFLAAPLIGNFFEQPVLILTIRIGCLSLVSAAVADAGAAACLSLLHPEMRALITTIRRSLEVTGLILITTWRTEVGDVVLVLALADLSAALAYSLATIRYMRRDPISQEPLDARNLFKRMWNYAFPLFGARLTEIGGRELGKLFLGRLASATAVGYYSVARLAVERLMTLMSQAPLAAVPVISQRKPGEKLTNASANQATLGLVKYQMMAANLLALLIWAIAPQFIKIIGGPEYGLAIPALRILSFGMIFWSGTASLHALFLVEERTAGIFFLNSTLILTTVTLYGFFVTRWQTNGAALSDSIGQSLTLGLGLWLTSRWFKFPALSGLRLFAKLAIPATLLGLPVFFVQQNLVLGLGWLVISIWLYVSYLLGLQLIDRSIWDQLEALQIVSLPILIKLQHSLLGALRNYQNFLLKTIDKFLPSAD